MNTNIFESPLVLLSAAVLLFVAVGTVRLYWPDKSKVWHFLLPVVVGAAGFAADHFVQTDSELIGQVIEAGADATVANQIDEIAPLIASNYSDGFHRSREQLLTSYSAITRRVCWRK